MTPIPQSDALRQLILSNIQIDQATGCWIWQRSKDKFRYGTLTFNGVALRVHRAAHALFNGPIPEGYFVCHHCDNTSCCNPDHLYAGTAQDNSNDMVNRGRSLKGRPRSVPFSDDTRQKISRNQLGRKRAPFSPEACENMGASHRGKVKLSNDDGTWRFVSKAEYEAITGKPWVRVRKKSPPRQYTPEQRAIQNERNRRCHASQSAEKREARLARLREAYHTKYKARRSVDLPS